MNISPTTNAYLASLNTQSTRESYGTPLRLFRHYLEQVEAEDLTVDHAIGFADWIKQRKPPYARGTVQIYLTAVYGYYRFLLTRGTEFSAVDLARLEEVYRKARNIRGEERPVDYTLDAVEKLIQAARAAPASPGNTTEKRRKELARLRNIAIVETFRATGCRIGELVGLRLSDIKHDGKRATVKGKGSKYRNIYWDDKSWEALLSYMRARGVTEVSPAPVFVSHGNRAHDGPLTTRAVSKVVRELRRKAGAEDVTAHYCRHVFATRALEVTENLALVQDLLGHASPATTRVYARTDERQRQEGHRQVWES